MAALQPRWLANQLRGLLRARPLFPVGHFYSPIPTADDCRRAETWLDETPVGIAVNHAGQAALAEQIGPLWTQFDRTGRWAPNDQLGLADAAVYASMLRHLRPSRIVEIGSGYSTAVALDAREAHDIPITIECVEPYTDRLRSLLRQGDAITIHEQPVQDVDRSIFSSLTAGDVLFIDSTHVAKHGSDVIWLILHILPTLAAGVVVHVHDIFWPFEYPAAWLEQRRGWNEIYLLRAFLADNESWQIEFFNDYIWTQLPELVERWLPEAGGDRPGGIWLRKVT